MDKVVDFLVRLREAEGNARTLVDLQNNVETYCCDFDTYTFNQYGRFDDSPAYHKDKQTAKLLRTIASLVDAAVLRA